MVTAKWFVFSQDIVRGPFEREALQSQLKQLPGALIWGRGQNEWLTSDQWEKMLINLETSATRSKMQIERQWRVRIGDQELQPMAYMMMIDQLKNVADFSNVLVWTEGYKEWKEVYQIHKIIDDLGVSRRKHPRVPIMGAVTLEGSSGNFQARALSISEGGLGITDAPSLHIGDVFKVMLKSTNLFGSLNATAEIVFVGSDGYCGLRFLTLNSESQSAIIEYVRKFSDGNMGTSTSTLIKN